MKLEFIIKNLIQNNKIKTQADLTDILSKNGFTTTQSNISRILKKLNTVKIVDENKETYYVIHNRPLEIVTWVKNLISNIESNENLIVIKTYNGAAPIISQLLQERSVEGLMTTVAGFNSIIVVPESVKEIEALVLKLKALFLINER